MEYFDLIEQRYSVRKFKEDKLPKEVIDKILNAAHIAPTGCNNQPQKIYVLQTKEALEKLKKCTSSNFNAPAAMIICYNKEEAWRRSFDGKSSGVCDASIVTTHMMLAAADLGVGSTWVMSYNPDALIREFDIPDITPSVAILVMGYPADDAAPSERHKKYKPLEDLVIYK